MQRTPLHALPRLASLLLAAALGVATPRPAPGQVVRGQVVRSDGTPVSGAPALLVGPEGAVVDSAASDGEGRFTLRGREAGAHHVVLEPTGYASYASPELLLAPGDTVSYRMEHPMLSLAAMRRMAEVLATERRFTSDLRAACGGDVVPGSGILLGVIRDRRTKTPLSGAVVTVAAAGGTPRDGPAGGAEAAAGDGSSEDGTEGAAAEASSLRRPSALSNENGTYILCNLPPGKAVPVRVLLEGRRPEALEVEVRPGTVSWYDVFLRPAG